jgi:hypothetical protein
MQEEPATRIRNQSLAMYCAVLRATTSHLHALVAHDPKFLAGLTDKQRKMIVAVSRALRPRSRVLQEIDRWIFYYETLWLDALKLANDDELRAVLVLGGDTERVNNLDALRETVEKLVEYEAKLDSETKEVTA